MQPFLEKLLALQERDARILALKKEQSNIPAERKLRESQFQTLTDKLNLARTRSKEIEVERKSLEGEVLARKEKIGRYRTQQMQTRKNEEYTALSHEVIALEKAISEIEDKELLLMEEADALVPHLTEAQAAYETGKKQIDAHITALETKLKNISQQLTGLEESRPPLTVGIEEDVLSIYERLFRSKGSKAIVALEGEVCTGCHMKVPTQVAIETRSNSKVVLCPQCGRMLYFPG